MDPTLWLGLSFLLVSVSLTVVMTAALPAFHELARAARSAEKLFDTLQQEFPPTLEALRHASLEVGELSEDVDRGVKNASGAIERVTQSVQDAGQQAVNLQVGTRGVVAGVRAAWNTWQRSRPQSPAPPSLHSSQSPHWTLDGERPATANPIGSNDNEQLGRGDRR